MISQGWDWLSSPAGPGSGSRRREGLPGLHCPGCPRASRFLPSISTCQEKDTMQHEPRRTSNEMWSFPIRISNSCFPTMFFLGQFVSSSLCTTPSQPPAPFRDNDHVLCDFARLDDPLELLHHERSDPHYEVRINSCVWSVWGDDTHSLSG